MRPAVQNYLAGKLAAALTVKPEEVTAGLSPTERAAVAALEARITATEAKRRKWGKIQALYDVGPTPRTYLLVRGNEQTPGAEVPPGFLRVLCQSDSEAVAAAPPPYADTSGRRTALARWLTDTQSPASALLARVMVNRVWKQLFGEGIVPTLDNFGAQGQRPTHPELLEWLSSEFIAAGWRVKPVIRLILTSTAYRQASSYRDGGAADERADPEAIDPGNELLWRMRMRRLEAEVVRDAILSVSGDLNRAAGGPPVSISTRPDGMVVVQSSASQSGASCRRSVYLICRRAYNLSLLSVFDQPLVATNCLKRAESAVPLQSLFMLNDDFLAHQAEHFARRVEQTAPAPPVQRIDMAFRMALARHPNAQETATCGDLLHKQNELGLARGLSRGDATHQALAQLCLTLLNTSEFLFAE